MRIIRIKDREINRNSPPFIIAEMSGNHNQSLDRALKIVDSAAEIGVCALKLQTYTADTMTLDIHENEFFIKDEENIWKGNSLYNLYKKAYTPWEWHEAIMKRAHQLGIICFSTPFDESAVNFLEDLNVPAYKIASFENVHLPLIKKVASTGKPVIVSTGMTTLSEIDQIISTLTDNGCKNFALLKCNSSYPTKHSDSNIITIPHMKKMFQCEIGLSDHTMGIGASIAAIAHGASIIEKHFTLDREDGGVDSSFSMQDNEMGLLVSESKNAWESIGKIHYGPTESEKREKRYQRSIYIIKDIYSGEKLSKKNIGIIRPGLGLPPKYFDLLINRKVKKDLKKGTALNWDLIA